MIRNSLSSIKSPNGVASWNTANQPRRLSASVIREQDFPGAANSGRVVSDSPTPIYTLDGSKRTVMLTPQLTGEKSTKKKKRILLKIMFIYS